MTFIGVTRGFEDEEGREVYPAVSTRRGIKNPLPSSFSRGGLGARAVWVRAQEARVLTPFRMCITGRGFFLDGPLGSTAQVCCAIISAYSISRQQGNTVASIMGPHGRAQGRVQFLIVLHR